MRRLHQHQRDLTVQEIRNEAAHYIKVQTFFAKLRRYYLNGRISYDQIKAMRDRALNGDVAGAAEELYAIVGDVEGR